jgi:hypothetical protein
MLEGPEKICSPGPEPAPGGPARLSSTDHSIGNRDKAVRTWNSLILTSKRAPHVPMTGQSIHTDRLHCKQLTNHYNSSVIPGPFFPASRTSGT